MSSSLPSADPEPTGLCAGVMPHLTDDQASAWVGFMTAHAEIVRSLEQGLGARFGLSISALEVLARVARGEEGRMRMSDLAHGTLFSPSRVSRVVDQLETRKLMERSSCPSDSRGVFAHITDSGRELVARALEWHGDQVAELFFGSLTKLQVASLNAIWQTIAATQGKSANPGV